MTLNCMYHYTDNSCSTKSWIAKNFLHLSETKTEVVVFGPLSSSPLISNNLRPLYRNVHAYAKNVGVFYDSELNFAKHVNTVVKTSFYHIRLIAKIKPMLSPRNLETVIHAFISSRLYYCNSFYLGISQSVVNRLQLVQNVAARLVTGRRKRDRITPILASLQWVPVTYRVDFKFLIMIFKILNGWAPAYQSDLVTLYKPART